jgi:hypothetical protein
MAIPFVGGEDGTGIGAIQPELTELLDIEPP